jgi:hypothetical protein
MYPNGDFGFFKSLPMATALLLLVYQFNAEEELCLCDGRGSFWPRRRWRLESERQGFERRALRTSRQQIRYKARFCAGSKAECSPFIPT